MIASRPSLSLLELLESVFIDNKVRIWLKILYTLSLSLKAKF